MRTLIICTHERVRDRLFEVCQAKGQRTIFARGFVTCTVDADRQFAEELLPQLWNRTVLLIGVGMREAFRLPPVIAKPIVSRGVTFRQLPHPSGRTRWYENPKHRKIALLLLEELYHASR